MGDPLQKVKAGDPLRIPAGAYNAFVETALAYKQSGVLFGGKRGREILRGGTVIAYNASGLDVPIYSVLELSTLSGTEAQVEFVKPGAEAGKAVYAIAIEPFAVAKFGLIAVSGGAWPLTPAASCEVGDTLGPVDGAWTAAAAGTPTWEVVRKDVDGVALVRFLTGEGTPPVYLEACTEDPAAPRVGEMWLRTEL